MRGRRLLMGVFVSAGVMAMPAVAAAEIDEGDCTGAVRFVNGVDGPFTIDADQSRSDVVVVPRSDTVEWSGSTPATSGDYSGSVSVKLPFPFGSLEIDRWEGTIESNSNAGVDTYDLPSVIPGGVEFEVSATHSDTAGTCSGGVRMKIEGGAFGSVATPIALVATAIFAGLALAIAGVFGGAVGGGAASGASAGASGGSVIGGKP